MNHARLHVSQHLTGEAQALLSRLKQTAPFSVSMPMVAAAAVSKPAMKAITSHWTDRQRLLRTDIRRFLALLNQEGEAAKLQARFAELKLRFNSLLDQFDIFADVVSQRAEHRIGVWIAGLDALAEDALQLPGKPYEAPPLMCFLERGHGAAIRKARTRLPGGDPNPVAIIQVPRERLVGTGIAASIIHEVGHQGVALLDLLASIRQAMGKAIVPPDLQLGWAMLRRWLSEILADFWAMAHLGAGATLGLMGVVGLPAYFVFRAKDDDPHPFPWIRVIISIAFGERLYPDPQWARIRALWMNLYPLEGRNAEVMEAIRQVTASLPAFTSLVIGHKNQRTQNKPLAELFPVSRRQPAALRAMHQAGKSLENLPPSLAFAIIGQARADGLMDQAEESKLLSDLLITWARRKAE